ncbi:MAG TPA: hypothetical protein VE567_08655, partial [Sphingomonas sp.]|nr:hypothetical protein [Sphingomonas sp.]
VVTASGRIAVDGAATGQTIAFTSNDLAIAATGQLGSKTQTSSITLTSTADRLFLGDAAGAGYHIDNGELTRIATAGDLAIVSAPTNAQGNAFALADPAGANVVIGSISYDGAQLGPSGTFRISSPRSIGFTGNAQFKNFSNGQTVTFAALNDISLAAETGLVTVKDSSGALTGTLRLEAQQVHAMSTSARSDIAGLGLNEARQRLGTNDQVQNDGGYFQAGQIDVRIGRLLFIQNSGANSDKPDDRRGFSANSFTIESTGTQPAQFIVNGRIGTGKGADLASQTTLIGSFDPQSGFNGCFAGSACGITQIEVAPALSNSRDQIESQEKEDEKEEALKASQKRPQPVIQFVEAPKSRFEPLVDEPVTGAGNEDLWEPSGPGAINPIP